MTPNDRAQIRDLLDRFGRLAAAEEWSEELNPAQWGALRYLARANRFSRAPSHVAAYLSTTRGTASQTLKALERKGFVAVARSETDRRSIRYDLTETGRRALARVDAIDSAIAPLSDAEAASLRGGLERIARAALARRGHRPFGLCRDCRHHRARADGGFCALLEVDLAPEEATQICHEQSAA